MTFEMKTPILPASRPDDRWKLTIIIISCATIACVLIMIYNVRLEPAAGEEPGQKSEPGLRGPDRLKEQQEASGPAGSKVRTATGLFAATENGLIALNLQTLESVKLTSGYTYAVAVNNELRKVYWAEGHNNCSIWRSNFDGSAREVIVPPSGDIIDMMAINLSGKLYFALWQSHEIRACDARGKTCSTVISNPSLVSQPCAIALDTVQGALYWANSGFDPPSLVRAKPDGSDARIIATGFGWLQDIALVQSENQVLYWADSLFGTIGTINVGSRKKQTLKTLPYPQAPWSMVVDDKIYFSNGGTESIESVDKDSGGSWTTIFSSIKGVLHLALFL